MSGLFVAGAGTDVGKTYVTASLARALAAAGRGVRVFKPLASGMPDPSDPAFADSDTARLLAAAGLAVTSQAVAACSPWRFAAPLSPDMAAALEGRAVDAAAVLRWGRARAAEPGEAGLLVEGVGGVMSPIAEAATNLDLAAALGLPVLLVCASYLGAISHGLTALLALKTRGLTVQALLVNESEGSTVDFDATIATFARFEPQVRVAGLRRGQAATPALIGLS